MSDNKLKDAVIESLISPMRILLEAQEAERRKCWLDGSRCPSGSPCGKFVERPTAFCQLGVCHKITRENIIDLAGNYSVSLFMPRERY